ncbi:MAG: hypothetical protein RO469_07860 [Thermincola sp.]|jgi:hypothetical protein|nr:hypothetical protein [Thermincola sp.]
MIFLLAGTALAGDTHMSIREERERKELEEATKRLPEPNQNAVQSIEIKKREDFQRFLMIAAGCVFLTGIVFILNKKTQH